MKDYYATLKIQQGRLKQAMHNAGIKTAAELARISGVHMGTIGKFLNFQKSPRCRGGEWKPSIIAICKALSEDPCVLFPDHLDREMPTNKITSFVDHAQLSGAVVKQLEPYEILELEETNSTINEVLGTLTERERSVLKCRFWDGKTLSETGRQHKVCGNNARLIEAKALRKLRHPSRMDKLKGVCDY